MHRITPINPDSKSILTKVYKESFFLPKQRKCFTSDNEVLRWALDLRYSLAKSRLLTPLTEEIIKILDKEKITQIVGRGYGSFFLIGAILAKKPNLRAGLIRYSQKPYGFKKLIEGDLRKNSRTLIIDDIIASGQSIKLVRDILRIKKIPVYGGLCIFRFGWKDLTGLPKTFKIFSVGVLHYKEKNSTRTQHKTIDQ